MTELIVVLRTQEFPATSLIHRLNTLFRHVGNLSQNSNQFSSLKGGREARNRPDSEIFLVDSLHIREIPPRRVRSRLPAPPEDFLSLRVLNILRNIGKYQQWMG